MSSAERCHRAGGRETYRPLSVRRIGGGTGRSEPTLVWWGGTGRTDAGGRIPAGSPIRFSLDPREPGDMNRLLVAGVAFVLVGLAGYVAGVLTPYAGRAFSVTAVMIGITLIAVRTADEVVR